MPRAIIPMLRKDRIIMKFIDGGVTAPKGFSAAGMHVGIKASNTTKKDMAMVYSEVPCKVAGTFTTNVVKAAPVVLQMHVLELKVWGIVTICPRLQQTH